MKQRWSPSTPSCWATRKFDGASARALSSCRRSWKRTGKSTRPAHGLSIGCWMRVRGCYSVRNARIASAVLATAIPSVRPSVSEQGMGRWVMGHGSNGSRKSDGSHGSWVTRCWPMTHQFWTLWLGLYILAMLIYRVSLWCMCNCTCDWRSSKFTFTFKFMLIIGLPRVPG